MKVDNIEFADVDHSDYPDFVDCYICSCDIDGEPADQEQLDSLNENRDFVYEELMNYLY